MIEDIKKMCGFDVWKLEEDIANELKVEERNENIEKILKERKNRFIDEIIK